MPTPTKKRATFYVEEDALSDFQNIAYWSRLSHTDAIGRALSSFIDAWKADPANKPYVKGGKINQRPEGE